MEYSVEDVSPVQKKITVKVAPEEVEAAIKGTTALYRQNAQLDGFRKGRVPASVVEKRFHDPIYKEARDDLINVHINDVLQKTGFAPVSGIRLTGDERPLEKGSSYEYIMDLEVMPEFELPVYEGLEVEEEKIAAAPEIIDTMLQRMQRERSRLEPVEGNEPAREGQIANIDFVTTLNGEVMKDFSPNGFDLELGPNAALPEFQEFVKTIPVGHTAEKVIHFPDDFISRELAGKDANMKVTVHAVKNRILPQLDENFAKLLGKKDMDEVRKSLADSYAEGMRTLQKAVTQQKLLKSMLEKTSFELPPGMVEMDANLLVGDAIARAEREGRNIASTREELEKLKAETRPAAEERTREKVLLMAIARKENLEVSNQEVEKEIIKGAFKMRQDVQEYFEKMRDSGLIFQLRDNMLTDKAMDLVYERAKVTLKEPEPAAAASV